MQALTRRAEQGQQAARRRALRRSASQAAPASRIDGYHKAMGIGVGEGSENGDAEAAGVGAGARGGPRRPATPRGRRVAVLGPAPSHTPAVIDASEVLRRHTRAQSAERAVRRGGRGRDWDDPEDEDEGGEGDGDGEREQGVWRRHRRQGGHTPTPRSGSVWGGGAQDGSGRGGGTVQGRRGDASRWEEGDSQGHVVEVEEEEMGDDGRRGGGGGGGGGRGRSRTPKDARPGDVPPTTPSDWGGSVRGGGGGTDRPTGLERGARRGVGLEGRVVGEGDGEGDRDRGKSASRALSGRGRDGGDGTGEQAGAGVQEAVVPAPGTRVPKDATSGSVYLKELQASSFCCVGCMFVLGGALRGTPVCVSTHCRRT
jgi:hypothetical protein